MGIFGEISPSYQKACCVYNLAYFLLHGVYRQKQAYCIQYKWCTVDEQREALVPPTNLHSRFNR